MSVPDRRGERLCVRSDSDESTRRLGGALGEVLRAGDVVGLEGDLGAGKTCFAQGVARGLGVPEERRVGSPTYTIVNVHTGRHTLYHVDLYRLRDVQELEEIGFSEMLESDGVAVVEWFERVPEAKPLERLEIQFAIVDATTRQLQTRTFGKRGQTLLTEWSKKMGAK